VTEQRTRGQRGLGHASLRLLECAAEIATEHGPISVRGVAYKLFVAEEIPSMEKSNVDKVGRMLVYGREHGVVDWDDIVDDTRTAERPAMWDNLADYGAAVARSYRLDRWASLPYNVQVWSEKATVGGVLRPITEEYGVPFLAVHGFSSATQLHDTAVASKKDRRDLVILYVGDHDPSGMFMSEVDVPKRLEKYDGYATIRRIALVEEDLPGLPSFPAKEKDPRYKWFRSHYSEDAWELDALDPNVLRERVEEAIKEYIDPEMWERMDLIEEAQQKTVEEVARAMAGAVVE
jgi:hypothetical protein